MRRGAAATVAAAGLLLCGAAEAKIVVGQSIHGVQVGMTPKQVRGHLGKGAKVPDNPQTVTYRKGLFQAIFEHGKVTSVETFKPSERTPSGLGVGTKLAKLKKLQPGVNCVKAHGGDIDCYVGSITRGHVYTDFYLGNGRTVTGVVVGAGYL
jgi:hypothetical protein